MLSEQEIATSEMGSQGAVRAASTR